MVEAGAPMPDPVVIVAYDPRWPETFHALRQRIVDVLGEVAPSVEHVGSTAVPGLAAKPIIDLDVVVQLADLPIAIVRLATLGYAHEGERGVPGREAFRWPPGEPRHHLYVCPAGSPELRRHLLFRDYLRTHPEAAAAYAALKRDAAHRFREDRGAYTAAKDPFVEDVLRRAGEQ
jgi:GrpB-like predicted nucleotidyltransferase (UPF0157 family)